MTYPRIYRFILSAAVMGALISGCATAPDPAKVCTSEWIGARSDKAVSRIERKAKPALRNLSKAAESWAKGKQPGPFQLLALRSSVNSLTKELETGQGMRDLKTLASTCNDPGIVKTAMTNVMRKNGLSDKMINFVENLPMYEELTSPEVKPQA